MEYGVLRSTPGVKVQKWSTLCIGVKFITEFYI